MYLQHFGLKDYPFKTAPDPRYYFPTPKHREALACLMYAVEQRKGFALITGEVGAGKTMLCRKAIGHLGDTVKAAMVWHTLLTPKQFVQAVCAGFGLDCAGKSKVELVQALGEFLEKTRQRNRPAVLIVDEAQDLAPRVLEEIRLLGNMEARGDPLMQIILVGQPEFRRIIGGHSLRQLEQRLALKFHLGPLTWSDVCSYIAHRLKIAGARDGELFDEAATLEVFNNSDGIPRLVNIICDQALLQAYVNDAPTVDAETVRRVIAQREGYYMSREDAGDTPEGDLRKEPAQGGCGELWPHPSPDTKHP